MSAQRLVLSRSIAGKVTIVTGAASGIGEATARLFADEGACVALIDRQGDSVAAVAEAINEALGREVAHSWGLDLGDSDRIPGTIADIVAAMGGVDMLVNNAGIAAFGALDSDDREFEAAWASAMTVNLAAYQRVARACLPALLAAAPSRIVNVASTESFGAIRGNAPYVASKHGVIGLTKAMAVDLARRGVTVNAVCPGPILTGLTIDHPEELRDRFARKVIPTARYGDPEEIAHAILSLVLPASQFITGATLVVDGGQLAQND